MKKLVKRIDASVVAVTGQYVSPAVSVTGLETETVFLSLSIHPDDVTVDPTKDVTFDGNGGENDQPYIDITF